MIAHLTPPAFACLVVLAIVMVEIGARLPLTAPAARMRWAMKKSAGVMRRRGVSDHWKQQIIMHCAGITFRAASVVSACVIVLAIIATLAVMTITRAVPHFEALTLSLPGIALIFAFATLYLPLRTRLFRGR